jgi:hypothetical protein
MVSRVFRRRLFAGWLAVAAFVPSVLVAAENADNETVVMLGNISYVSGGIGEDSRERLKAFASAFNLKLLLAKKSGEYLGDVEVVINDAKGRELIKAVAEGPIAATTEGLTQKQRVSVVKGKLGTMHFRWP